MQTGVSGAIDLEGGGDVGRGALFPQAVACGFGTDLGRNPDEAVRIGEDAFGRDSDEAALGQDDEDDDEEGGDGDDGAEEDGSMAMASTSCDVYFPVGLKMPQCFLCKRKADEPSPLTSSRPNDKYGGKVPWNSYKKVKKQSFGKGSKMQHLFDFSERL